MTDDELCEEVDGEVVEGPAAEVAVRAIGEVIDGTNIVEVTVAYQRVQELEDMAKEGRAVLARALAAIASHLALGRTFEVDGIGKVGLSADEEVSYDAGIFERELRAVGAPQEVIDRCVVTVPASKRVDAVKAKQAAKGNPKYEAALAAATTRRPVAVKATVPRRQT